jgi:hypothetical protein
VVYKQLFIIATSAASLSTNPPGDGQSAVGWGVAGFEPGTAVLFYWTGTQVSKEPSWSETLPQAEVVTWWWRGRGGADRWPRCGGADRWPRCGGALARRWLAHQDHCNR